MARRRSRKRWQKALTRFFVAAISDVRADLKKAHQSATTARTADRSKRGLEPDTPRQAADRMTMYEALYPMSQAGMKFQDSVVTYQPGDAGYARQQRNTARFAEQWKARADIAESGTTQNEYSAMTPEQRQQYVRKAGLCGAKCKDGTPCLNRGRCPVPSHRRK